MDLTSFGREAPIVFEKTGKVRHLLLDGDYFVYRYAFAADEVEGSRSAKAESAILGFNEGVNYYKTILQADKVTICMSCDSSECFRKVIYPNYKQNRVHREKPGCFPFLREYARYLGTVYPQLEADDVMGILATEPTDEERIIVSQDKDMRTIPGLLCRISSTGFPSAMLVTEDGADLWFMTQALMGDSTDSIPGIYGVGPVKASKLLRFSGDRWATVVQAYLDDGQTEADALMNARLVRILRHGDYDKETNEVKLWEPTK